MRSRERHLQPGQVVKRLIQSGVAPTAERGVSSPSVSPTAANASNSGLRKRVSFAEEVAPDALPVEPEVKSAADLSDTESSSSDADAGDLDLIYKDLPETD